MGFDYLDLAGARANVLARLQDPNGVFWIADEVDDAIRESLQVWNVATLYHRERGTFHTTPRQSFYDISTVLSNGSELILQRTLTAQQIAKRIIYALMENQGQTVDGSSWVGTEMFSLDDITQAIYRRVNRFLEETGQIVTNSSLPVTSGDGRVDLGREWVDVRRASWTTPEDAHSVLWRTSEYVLDSQFDDWETSPQAPQSYSVAVAPLIWLQLGPPPSDIGTLDLLTVDAVTDTAVVNVFNDFGWAIKYGAMADLLGQQGEAYDPERSAYGEQRYNEGIQLSKIMTTVLRVMINGQSVQPCSVFDLDAGVEAWEDILGSPTFATGRVTQTVLNPVDGTTLTVGSELFVWVNVVVNPTDVLIGATIADSYQAMANAINVNTETAECTATLNGTVMTLTANAAGEPGNSTALSISDATYGTITTFSGGVALDDLATPSTPAFASPNLVALYPVPDVTRSVPAGDHSITMDVVRNAILPVDDNDKIQIERGFLDIILDLAVHQLSFKIGGAEWQATFQLYQRAYAAAQEQNERLKAIAPDLPILATQEESDRPRLRAAA